MQEFNVLNDNIAKPCEEFYTVEEVAPIGAEKKAALRTTLLQRTQQTLKYAAVLGVGAAGFSALLGRLG